MKKIWNKSLNIGVSADYSFLQTKEIRLVNAFGVVSAIIASAYTLFLLLLNSPELAVYDAIIAIGAIGVIVFNYFRKHMIARLLLFFFFTLVLVSINRVYGRVGCEYYFFPMLILVVYLKRKWFSSIVTLYYIILFILAKYYEQTVVPAGMAKELAPYFYYVNVSASFILGIIFLRLFIVEYEVNRLELKDKNIQLENSNKDLEQKSQKIKTLLKELSHRTKNNLQLISSLINIQSKEVDNQELKLILNDVKNRINSIALMHKSLSLNKFDDKVNINHYINEIVSSFEQICSSDNYSVKFSIDVEEIAINLDNVIPFGIVLNELLTNSVEHGLLNTDDKSIKVSLSKTDSNKVKVIVFDSGAGIDKLNSSKQFSFGLELVNSLVNQLDGQIKFYENNGNYTELILNMFDDE